MHLWELPHRWLIKSGVSACWMSITCSFDNVSHRLAVCEIERGSSEESTAEGIVTTAPLQYARVDAEETKPSSRH